MTIGDVLEARPPFEPVTTENIRLEIGLVHEFFLKKLQANNNEALLEDDDLPIKQRFPKPRLPPTGKITSPRKRPPKEVQLAAKKKRKVEENKEDMANGTTNGDATADASASAATELRPQFRQIEKLKLEVPVSRELALEPSKDDSSVVGMMSPESITV